jgi:hypothetical protein
MYKFCAVIIIDPFLPAGDPHERDACRFVCDVLAPMKENIWKIDIREEKEYYYPSEEYEMRSEDYVIYHLRLYRECNKMSSVVYLSQLFSSIAALSNSISPASISFELNL